MIIKLEFKKEIFILVKIHLLVILNIKDFYPHNFWVEKFKLTCLVAN